MMMTKSKVHKGALCASTFELPLATETYFITISLLDIAALETKPALRTRNFPAHCFSCQV